MHGIFGQANKVFQVSLVFLLVLAGCANRDESFVAPNDTPEGTVYAAFEVHRNSLAVTDATYTESYDYNGVDINAALIAVGRDGRGLLYPNDSFATPLILQSEADFLGLQYIRKDFLMACGEREDGSAVMRVYGGNGWDTLAHSATGNLTAISKGFFCSDEGEILKYSSDGGGGLNLIFQAPEGVRFNDISSLTYEPNSEVIAVGGDGAIFHRYPGGEFVDESVPGGPDFIAIEIHGDFDIFLDALAVSRNEIWQFDQFTWDRVYRDPSVALNNIKYISDDEVLAVGNGGVLLRRDGGNWTVESLGEDVDIVAVAITNELGGTIVDLCGSQGEVFQRGDGWSSLNHHASGPWSAFFTSSNGTRYAANGNKLMRFDQEDWVEEAELEGYEEIADFHVVAPDQIWALVEMAGGFDQYIFFYNGSDWTFKRQSSLDEFSAIWCDATGDNVFVTAGHGQIFWYHGGVWELAVALGTSDAFHALAGPDMENLLAVGDSGLIMRRGPGGWTDESHATTHSLRAISGPVLAGDGGTILRQANGAWQAVGLDYDGRFNGVWYGGDDNIWAVGDDAGVMHFDGTEWTRLLTHLPGINFLAATGADADQVWIGGSEGYLLRSPE